MKTPTRVLLTALLCTAAVACSKKVKEEAPVDTTPTTPTTTQPATAAGAYGPEDLDTDACLRQRVVTRLGDRHQPRLEQELERRPFGDIHRR